MNAFALAFSTRSALADDMASSSDSKPMKWIVAVDGSKGSRATYEDLISLSRRIDAVHVVTVAAAKDKAYLPHDEKPQAVKEYYEVRLAGKFAKDRYTVSIIQRKEGEDTAKALLGWVDAKHPDADFLVVGFVGRKGPKADAHALGSVADLSLRAAHMPAVISKNAAAAEQNSFLVAVDGSDRAHAGVELALRLMKEGDRTTVLHVDDPSDRKGGSGSRGAEAVEARYAAFCAAHPQASFRCVVRAGDQGIADAVIAASEDTATHIICGVDGLGKLAEGKAGADASIGSVSDRIVRGASCTVIAIQGKKDTYAGGAADAVHGGPKAAGGGR
jgi:nucleotide-binding universal stress UspA family protein